MPAVRSVALGLWVRVGSRDEVTGEEGLSHFLEHLLFKGTPRFSAIEIGERFDGLGAAVNAATGKETTHLYARFLDEHTDDVFDLLAEMLSAPTFPDIDSERQVVLEEIAMYEDEPSDRVHDVFAEALFGKTPLGRRVLGRAEVISGTPVAEIAGYHQRHYRAGDITVAAAGNVDHERIVKLAEEHLGGVAEGSHEVGANASGPNGRVGQTRLFYPKETEQYHLVIGARGINRADERRHSLAVLDSILGGSTSSRLFREVREKRGLAYSVGSYSERYVDAGLAGIYVGTRPENVAEVCQVIGGELGSIRESGVSDQELARAKEHVKGRIVLSAESTSARMARIAQATIFGLPVYSLDEQLALIDGVGREDVGTLAAELYAGDRLSAAAVGADEAVLADALAPVSEALAA
jgi:predicted Zn-dependent peptidase